MTGDNLSNNFVGGYSKSFSHSQFCRYCTIRTSDIFNSFDSNCFEHRTHASIEIDATDETNGMKYFSPFMNLPYIKMPVFFTPDIMHDCLEGVCHLVAVTAFREMLRFPDVCLQLINEIVKQNISFNPATITMTHLRNFHLPFTASQMSYIMQFIPSMIGYFFAFENPVWNLVLMHCEILSIIFIPNTIHVRYIEHLRYLLIQQNTILTDIYGEACKYKCKLHIICHYPDLIKKFGCLIMFNVMRFEAVHKIFKQLMRKIHQYKNVTFTLSNRFSRRHSIVMSESAKAKIWSSCPKTFDIQQLDLVQLEALKNFGYEENKGIEFVEHLHFKGHDYFSYKKQTAIAMAVETVEYDPEFWIVKHILHFSNRWVPTYPKT